ncbi:hypothetical protein SAMN06264365_116117 [Actinoplanes regularis]|uniref:Lipoprotein n=2 Tax=Actinoplanes regularis TaxID=52697 RepID=A0A239EW67_9ACTN|nr:hypothetical protein Are01nite_62590 [Actinoplanes regularis]SNS48283.1 hypothetical protein SAMN06264365_116117 [Actinoplanes regularis]
MRSRLVPAALLCACLTGLAACDGGNTEADTQVAPPAAAASSAPAGAASTAPGDASTLPGGTTGGNGSGDKALCQTLNKAGSVMKNNISQAQKADGHVEVADAKKAFTTFHSTVTKSLASAPESSVTAAARAIATEIAKAATSADPISTAAAGGFEKLSGNLTTACKTAGVTINF